MSEVNIINSIAENEQHESLAVSKEILYNNRYRQKQLLGEGGLSQVFLASDLYDEYFGTKRNIALKIPSKTLQDKKDVAAFVYAEYTILRHLECEHIIKAYDFGIDLESDTPYIVLEYLQGERLDELPYDQIPLSEKKLIVQQLEESIHYLHANDIVHGDINPRNIMLSKEGKVTLFDFGIAHHCHDTSPVTFSFDNMQAFNPLYSHPKIVEGRTPSKESDWYSFALVVYELFTSHHVTPQSNVQLSFMQSWQSGIPISWYRKLKNIFKNN